MIHVSYGLLGAVLTALLLTLLIVVLYLEDIPLLPKIAATLALIISIISVWIYINDEWDWWTERNKICYPDETFVDSTECQEFENEKNRK